MDGLTPRGFGAVLFYCSLHCLCSSSGIELFTSESPYAHWITENTKYCLMVFPPQKAVAIIFVSNLMANEKAQERKEVLRAVLNPYSSLIIYTKHEQKKVGVFPNLKCTFFLSLSTFPNFILESIFWPFVNLRPNRLGILLTCNVLTENA